MGSERKPSLEAPSLRRKPKPERKSGVSERVEPATRSLTLPDGHLAAGLTGALVGAFLVLATLGGLRGCESLRGTSSCGGPGFPLLLAIVVVAWLAGAALLRLGGVQASGSISFLAVALVSVLTVLFLLDAIDDWSGAVAVLVLTVAAYLLSHWVTTAYINP
ncbi:hypothetical protein [Nocardioides sp.]|uniref:hypothetical protein n=1 Tax=Nocardioides sp. TaxID=35761 RepID=UPI0039E35B05